MPRFKVTVRGRPYAVTVPDGQNEKHAAAYAMRMEAQRVREGGKAKADQPKGLLRRADDFVRGVADTVTLGHADEIAARLGSLTGIGGERGDYAGNVASQRQTDKMGGGERLTGQIAGAFALPVSKIAAAPKLAGVAGAAAEGAGYGAAYGFGSAEGGIEERLRGAKTGAMQGAAGGVAGRAVGKVGARILGGPKVPAAVRKLADEGVVMTPGRRGGKIARTMEESVLGSIPFVNSIPAAANRRSVEQLNVAAYNRVLKPLGQKLPMKTPPGRDAVQALGDVVYTAYDDAASKLNLGLDGGLAAARAAITKTAPAKVGQSAPQLQAIINNTLAPLDSGPVSGLRVRDILADLRGEASGWMASSTKSDKNVGKELWALHDHLEAALVRQNKGDVLNPFKAARSAVSNLQRVEAAAAKSADGVFNPQQFSTAVSKRGYGTTTSKLARGEAQMQDLADAAKQVLPAQIPNSGSPERAASLIALTSGGGAYIDPTLGTLTGASLLRYAPGVDRLLQNFSLNRPSFFTGAGGLFDQAAPYLGTSGALAAASQGR